jgi:4-alpha-glucanotransferase
VKEKLLSPGDLAQRHLPRESRTNYAEAERVKRDLFDLAWNNFKQGKASYLKEEFEVFKQKEAEWLQDFALYMVLKQKNGGKPWYQWDQKYMQKDKNALEQLAKEEDDQMEKTMWLQFIFAYQWKKLKALCNGMGIRLIGDLPFYISYDSSDVWAHRHLFAVDEEGNTTGMAGVPPDAFSDDGQLWGMPVFKWDVLKEQNYNWWIERFRKNMELFDIVRLDHFRAFSSYWEVPAGEKTARNGQWKTGPGSGFFRAVEKEFGELPFIAEDLGDIDEPVYELRDEFHLPGMKVLQFAFGDDMPDSVHIPHNHTTNFIVYTGTHDNNTVKGWFREEGQGSRPRIEQYLEKQVSDDNIPFILSRMAYGSVARMAILPLQDVLGLDQSARMNIPASGSDNWAWRLISGQVNTEAEERLKGWVELFNR